jgi:hypothetical protein
MTVPGALSKPSNHRKGADWNDFTNELPAADFVPKAIVRLA